jgi:CxxC motif-containing protein (DUF1111 family)/cytochrome c553
MPSDRRMRWMMNSALFVIVAVAGCSSGQNVGGNSPATGFGSGSSGPAGGSGSVSAGSGSSAPGSGSAETAGSGSAGASGTMSGGGSGTGVIVPPACVPEGGTAPTLPPTFALLCGGCHSASGAPANPAVPNLFTYAATAQGTAAAFLSQVRAPKGGTLMPPFTTAQISDAEVQQVYDYFKAGTPGQVGTCPAGNGTQTGNLGGCSGQTVSFTPLFASVATPANPISYVDATKHIIFRGAGRVRFRHEMETTFEVYHDHYFENRTFGYILDDSIPAGGTTIKVTFLPNVNQFYSKQGIGQEGGADLNMRYWKIYGGVDGNVFAGNAGGASNNVLPDNCADPKSPLCNTQKWTYTITTNERDHRAIQMGDQLQVEFGIFIARYGNGQGPPVDGTHVRNILNPDGTVKAGCTLNGPPYSNACYTQANYYSDSFRYVVGKGMLTPYNQDCTMTVPPAWQGTGMDFPHPYDCSPTGPIAKAVAAGLIPDRTGPDEAGWSGGTATMSYIRQRHDLYYSQMSPNIQVENAANFVQGRRLFHTDYTTGKHIEINNDLTAAETAVHAGIAGPLYNQLACEGCHSHNNRGFPPAAGMPFDSIVVKTAGMGKDPNGAPMPDPNYGRQLQNKGLGGATAEGTATFTYQTVAGQFGDGTSYSLTKPTTTFMAMSAGNPVAYSVRLARPLIGMGLLEAIPEPNILARADPTDCNGDGIKGIPNLVFDPEDGQMHIGRFGWKASKASIRHQAAEALLLDIGVTTSVFPKHDCGAGQAACLAADKATPELSASDLDLIVTYLRGLAVPPRRDLNDPKVVRGETLFAQIGCINCHAPNQNTGTTTPFLELQNQTIHPYSDLLLHDMGTDLADNSQSEYAATATMWRTPPLWGIGLCDEVSQGYQADMTMNPAPNLGPCHYLHDGRAATPLEAVLWHGGEALGVKTKVLALPSADRDALVAFLKSL